MTIESRHRNTSINVLDEIKIKNLNWNPKLYKRFLTG